MPRSPTNQLEECTETVREIVRGIALESQPEQGREDLYAEAYSRVIRAHVSDSEPGVPIVGERAESMRTYAATYQWLLAERPVCDDGQVRFEPSDDRRRLGSFYTPKALVDHLVEKALRTPAGEQAKPALDRRVCDPSAGVGAFLVGAARRLALMSDDPDGAVDAIVRDCLYGVDIDPVAAALCRAVLATMTTQPVQMYERLATRIKVGNAIVGAKPELIERGIPREAFVVRKGDVPAAVSWYKRRNTRERRSSKHLQPARSDADLRLSADAWCAAFLWRRHDTSEPGAVDGCPGNWDAMTQKWFDLVRTEPECVPGWMLEEVRRLSAERRFFHWHLEFPEIFTPPLG